MIYFELYLNALDNYHSIVGKKFRQILVDESKVFYSQKMIKHNTTNLISNETEKNKAIALLNSIKNDHTYMIVLRDDIAFVVIHYAEDNFIIIDPHVECCGILSKTGVYRYIVYDSVWNFVVCIMIPEKTNVEIQNGT